MSFIAIVDDSTTNRRIWARLAQDVEDGVQVESFPDPAAALARIERETPDLVITDFQMPGMDGAEFIRHIRRLPDCEDVPVIVVSVYEDRTFRYEALEAGATDFLRSPVDHYEFTTRARNLLTLRKQQLLLKLRALDLEDELRTETARHAQAMRQSHDRLLEVIDTVPAAIYASDADGTCLFMNRFGARLFGVDHEAAAGRRLAELFGPAKAALDKSRAREALGGSKHTLTYEEPLAIGDGPWRTLVTTKTPMSDPASGNWNVLTVALDITERKAMEEELRAAMDAAEQASRAKTEFLANMSHELRTPLNAIIGFSEMMATEHLGPMGNPRYREYAADIESSATHLLGVISNILDLARLEEGQLDLKEQDIDVAGALKSAAAMISGVAEPRKVTVTTKLPSILPGITGDRKKFSQVVLNVLANAVKFAGEAGNVSLKARTGSHGGLEIVIEDDGIGMTAEQMQVARLQFGQVFERQESKPFQGTGLGLPIAIGFVELHGGTLDMESEVDAGTKVTIRFPKSRSIIGEESECRG